MKNRAYLQFLVSFAVVLLHFNGLAQTITLVAPAPGSIMYIPPDKNFGEPDVKVNFAGCHTYWKGYFSLDGEPPRECYSYSDQNCNGTWSHSYQVGAGVHTLRAYVKHDYNILADSSWTFTYIQTYAVTLANSFGSGSLKVDGSTYVSGISFTWASGETHTAEAIDGQSYGGHLWRYNNWSTPTGTATSQPIQIYVNGNHTYTANFGREFNISFQNSLPGAGNSGVIKVNGTQYNSPASTFIVREPYSITGEALYQVINGIEYTFSSWSPGGSTSASTTFTPGDHTTYTANFNAKPQPPTNVQAGGAVGENVRVTWTDNPNSNVTYQVWREPKNQPSQFVVSVGSGVGSWTDPAYKITGTGSDGLLFYHVYSYYSSTLSDPVTAIAWATQQGPEPKLVGGDGKKLLWGVNQVPQEFAVGNYPNPFNPSTTIAYQLAKESSVKIEIYDVMGRKLRSLVDENKSAGYYTVVWNGRDETGRDVASGLYLYRFIATPINGEKAFKQSGKLLLTR